MIDLLTSALVLGGASFMLIAALGILRMPDLPMRMHASTKAGALGGGMVAAAVALQFDEFGVTARALAIVLFIIMTAPVAAHLIARASYFVSVPLWERTVKDELKGRYDYEKHTLASAGPPDEKPRVPPE